MALLAEIRHDDHQEPCTRPKIKKELIDGIWYMSPTAGIYHGIVVGNLSRVFGPKIWGTSCLIFSGDLEVYYNNDENYIIPDFTIVCNKDFTKRGVANPPEFVVEVLSPSTHSRDKTIKKAKYEALGVVEYWLISPAEKSIEVHLLVDGKYELADAYVMPCEIDIERMTEKELTEIVYTFKMSIFDEMEIDIRDVFLNIP